MAQLDIPLGYTLFATTEVTAFKQRCINEAEEQAKKKYLHAVTERDTVIANASSYVEKLLKEKSDLVSKAAVYELLNMIIMDNYVLYISLHICNYRVQSFILLLSNLKQNSGTLYTYHDRNFANYQTVR